MSTRQFKVHSILSCIFLVAVILGGLILTGYFTSAYSESRSSSEIYTKNTLYFFWGEGCPHCAAAKPFLLELNKKFPTLIINSHEIYNSPENLAIMKKMAKSHGTEPTGVPTIFFGEKMYVGFSKSIAEEIEVDVSSVMRIGRDSESLVDNRMKKSSTDEVTIPLLGKKDAQSLSIPLFTVIIAGLDSFNPCAFFVLFTLLSLLVHAHSRKRMLLIGGVFVFFSGCIYFLFMATWLNLYFIIGNLTAVTYIAGVLALIIALINIKDFFYFKKGPSLSISESSKPKLFERMRRLLRTESLPSVMAGSIVLAVTANSYELLCTAGFPMIYTRVLTLNDLPSGKYYAYLALYNLIYVLPLAIIVVFFVATLGSKKLSEWQGRVLKLLSGLMMLSLALILLISPSLLQNALFSVALLLGVVSLTTIIATLTKKYFKSD